MPINISSLSFPSICLSVFYTNQTGKFNGDILEITTVVAKFLMVDLLSESPPVMCHCF